MMQAVKSALEDADVALLIVDVNENWEECNAIFTALRLKVPAIVVINKIDLASAGKIKEAIAFFAGKILLQKYGDYFCHEGINMQELAEPILELLPEGEPFYRAMISVICPPNFLSVN